MLLPALSSEELTPRPLAHRSSGRVLSVHGPVIRAELPFASVGDWCTIKLNSGKELPATVLAFDREECLLAPLDPIHGLSPSSTVLSSGLPISFRLPESPLGGIFDCLGQPLDLTQAARTQQQAELLPIYRPPPPPLSRKAVESPFSTGVRAVDALCTLGRGQRVALAAPAGTGKSTLLGALARNAKCDVVVVGLIGERGREVNEFLDSTLGREGRKRSVVIVSTSDETPLRRSLAAQSATSVAEHFRSQGKNVLLLIDSLTRVARAIRELTLAAGELPVRQGYTASVFTELPRLMERAGNDAQGSITAIYTLLSNGDGDVDPLTEEVKSLLDGHLVLDQRIALSGIRPAFDPLYSVSRSMNAVSNPAQRANVQVILQALQRLRKDKDMLLFGGTPDRELAHYLELESQIRGFLNQDLSQLCDPAEALAKLQSLAELLKNQPR